jgi:cytochrome c5
LRYQTQQTSNSSLLALGIVIGMALGPVSLAASPDSDAIPSAPVSTDEAPAAPISAAAPVSAAAGLTGSEVYKTVCIACHSPPGVGGAPALGNVEAWAPRIAQGMDTLVDHALHGFSGNTGVMPKKGERVDLSDEEVIGAVRYMVEQAAPSEAVEE